MKRCFAVLLAAVAMLAAVSCAAQPSLPGAPSAGSEPLPGGGTGSAALSVAPLPPAAGGTWLDDLAAAAPALAPYDVYLIGEVHANVKTYQAELQLLEFFVRQHGVRSLLLEVGFCDAMLLNEYLQTGDATILDLIMRNLKGSSAYNVQHREFLEGVHTLYHSLPQEQRFTLYGVDVQHQYATGLACMEGMLDDAAPREIRAWMQDLRTPSTDAAAKERLDAFLVVLQENAGLLNDYFGERADAFCKAAESMAQGANYYYTGSDEYREQCFTENFFAVYEEGEGKYLGIWGRWHTNMAAVPAGLTYNNVAQNAAERLGRGENGVCSIRFVYSNSFSSDGEGNVWPLGSEEGEVLSARAQGVTRFFVLDPEDEDAAVRELAQGNQFAVSITGSPAAGVYQ